MRKRQPTTIIRELRHTLKRAQDAYLDAQTKANDYRSRATRAETASKEWEHRFDLLLLTLSNDVRDRISGNPGIFGTSK